jgi:hypothetical protein
LKVSNTSGTPATVIGWFGSGAPRWPFKAGHTSAMNVRHE